MNKKKIFDFKNFRFKSIQSNIAFTFSFLFIFTIIIIAFFSYRLIEDLVRKNSQEYVNKLIEQVNNNIDAYISYMENVSSMLLYNSDIQHYFSNNIDKENKEKYKIKIIDLLNSIKKTREDIISIILFGYNGEIIIDNMDNQINPFIDYKEQSWYKSAQNFDGKASLSSSHVQNIIKDKYRWVVSLSRELKRIDSTEKIGILLVDLNFNIINNMCKNINLGKRGYIFIINKEGDIVFHPQQQLIYSNLKREMISEVILTNKKVFTTNESPNNRIYNISTSSKSGWKIIGVTYVDELVGNKKAIQIYFTLLGIGCLITTILFSIFISRRISKPIKYLSYSMQRVENGNFDIEVNINSSDEIGELSMDFNIMIKKIKELMRQNIQDQEQKRMSELKALQAQINPHFLYNTLDSIIWMAEAKKHEEVVEMTSALANLFRLSISKGEQIIPIKNEIEHIKNYLIIQKMRYKDKLDFKIDVDEKIMEYKILKILLQPLVENSIYHGIKNKTGMSLIQIYGEKIENKILLKVIDDGVGMNKYQIKNIFKKSKSYNSKSGVGVRNVNERIKLYFGNNYGITFVSKIGIGTTAKIWLPILEQG